MREGICIKIIGKKQLDNVKELIAESEEAGKPYYGFLPCYLEFSIIKNCWVLNERPTENVAVMAYSYLMKHRMEIIPPKLSYEKLKEGFDKLYEAYEIKTKEFEELKSQVLEEKHMPDLYENKATSDEKLATLEKAYAQVCESDHMRKRENIQLKNEMLRLYGTTMGENGPTPVETFECAVCERDKPAAERGVSYPNVCLSCLKDPQVSREEIKATNFAEQAPSHYDNSKGSLYKVASERGWNPYLFDIVKRLERGGKKDPLEQEIDKTIFLLKLWKAEI